MVALTGSIHLHRKLYVSTLILKIRRKNSIKDPNTGPGNIQQGRLPVESGNKGLPVEHILLL